MLKYQDMKKQWGGHTTGFLEGPGHSQGSGSVFDVRKALGFSQSEMAEKIGCSLGSVKRIESEGKTGDKIFKVAACQRSFDVLKRRAGIK